jgi:cell division protein FtsW (lipid II flippase)
MLFEAGSAGKFSSRIPYGVLIPLFVIVAVGILNLSSASQATRPDLYLSQIARFGLALILLTATALIHTRIIRQLAMVAYGASLILLALVLVVGHTAKGAERWLVIGALRLQPSDPAKLALVLAIARYCSLYWPQHGYRILSLLRPLNISRPLGFIGLMVLLLVKGQHGTPIFSNALLTSNFGKALMGVLLMSGIVWLFLALLKLYRDKFQLQSLVAPVDIPLLPFLLICVEPDLATGLVVLAIAGIMFLYVRIQTSSLLIGAVATIALAVTAYFTVLMDYQKQRILSFLNPEADLKGEGYHAMQSIIAIGSGRLTGKGYNGGTQTQLSFLPENATDFVFSVWAEEWGFVACMFLIILYFILLWGILKIANKIEDQFSQLICVGVAAAIFIHVIINMGMVMGLMPVAGIPLPLMSFGGSSLNITSIGIGLVVNVALWRGEK